MGPHLFCLLDPDPGEKNVQIKTEKSTEMGKISKFIQFYKSKFAQASFFHTFGQSLMFFQLKKTFHMDIFDKFV